MIPKNIVYIAQSLDGYIAGPNEELDWLDMIPNPNQEGMGYYDLMDEIDALVMGRSTYQIVINFGGEWPYKKHVYVLSNTLSVVPDHLAGKITILSGTIPQILDKIHSRSHYKLYIDGGKTVQSFLTEDLVDELRITTLPILLGAGIPLFGHLENRMEFDHIKTEVYLDQLVQSHYKRKK